MDFKWLFSKNFFLQSLKLPVYSKVDKYDYDLETVLCIQVIPLAKYFIKYENDLQLDLIRQSIFNVEKIQHPSKHVQYEMILQYPKIIKSSIHSKKFDPEIIAFGEKLLDMPRQQ